MLKYKLNQEEHTALDETLKTLYSVDGDGFILGVEGAASKDKLDEFRAANTELLKAQKGLDGINMEKYNSMLETEQKIRDKELIEKGDFETLIAERLAASTSDFNAKLNTASTQVASFENKYNSLVSKHEIEGAALTAFSSNNIRPDAHNAILAQIKSTFSIDNGVVIAKQGDTILTGADGNLTINEFVASQPEFMRVPNQQGAATGGNDNQSGMRQGSTSGDKIKSGLAKMMNQ